MKWHKGNWFGGQIGATAWILVAGLSSALRDLPTGLMVILLCAIPNVVGVMLWQSRKLSFHASIQVLIGVSGVSGLVAVYLLERADLWTRIQMGAWSVSATAGYGTIGFVYGGLMLLMFVRLGRTEEGSLSGSD